MAVSRNTALLEAVHVQEVERVAVDVAVAVAVAVIVVVVVVVDAFLVVDD